MKIALVGPELEENLSLRYLHAALSNAGHEPSIFNFHSPEQINSLSCAITAFKPELVGLSMVFTSRAREYLRLADTLREKHGYRGHITAGGHFASFHAEQLLLSFQSLNTIIHGEGEETLVKLANNIGNPQSVNNMSYRGSDNKIYRTDQKPNNPDLDSLIWPTRTPPMQKYLNLPIANMLSGRGCFGNCNFCSIAAWHRENGGQRFRFRTPENVAQEMAHLYHDYGVRIFNFHDDNFFYPREKDSINRFQNIADYLKKEKVGTIAVQVKARPDTISQPIVSALKKLGLFRVFLGVESNAVAGLKALGRGITRECNHTALNILQRNGIHTTFNLLMFEPDMTTDDLLDNISMLSTHSSFPLNFGRVEVYGGTPLEKKLREENLLIGTYFGYNYNIKDSRMQTAFELFRKVFTGRNFDVDGMNHLSMRLDYYYHLLHHFYPNLVTKDLKKHTKKYIANLNRNSSMLLKSIHDFVTGDACKDSRKMAQFGDDLLRWRESYDCNARKDFLDIIDSIQNSVTKSPFTQKNSFSAMAATAAAAVLVVVSTNCDNPVSKDDSDHEITMPLNSEDWSNAPLIPQYQADMVACLIKKFYERSLTELTQAYTFNDKLINIDLLLNSTGSVALCRASVSGTADTTDFVTQLEELVSNWSFNIEDFKGGKCTAIVTLKTFPYPADAIRNTIVEYHVCEIIGMPPDLGPAKPVQVDFLDTVWNNSLWETFFSFDSGIVADIREKINMDYLHDFTTTVHRFFPDDSLTFSINMIVDAFGKVTMFKIQKEGADFGGSLKSELTNMVANWNFTFIKTTVQRSGKCTIALNIKSKDLYHYSEMIPFPNQ